MVEAEVVTFLSSVANTMGGTVARAAAEAIAGGVSLFAMREGLRRVYRTVKEQRRAKEAQGDIPFHAAGPGKPGQSWDEYERDAWKEWERGRMSSAGHEEAMRLRNNARG